LAPTRATQHAGNLPVELTSFVGRRQGLADLKHALASTRLLTLTGAGGIGKTKLALRAGRESVRQYPDGVWFVELASVQDPSLVIQAVFTAMGLQDRSSHWAVTTLTEYLAKKRPLLILDNCEHVLDPAAVLAGTLLRGCPDLRILATSRQALGVTGEVVIDVPTLSLPDDGDGSPASLLRSDAVALFVERAGAVQQDFAVDPANAAAVLNVCRHLDGMPLALELAAVRLKALGLVALDEGLSARLGSLGVGDRSASPRQLTLEAAIDWSYQLLSEHERSLWTRLSVFAGGFQVDAAQAVCIGEGLDADEIPTLLGALVEKSVLKRRHGLGADRFRLLEPLRLFGLERLREADAETKLRARHRDWIKQLAVVAGANDGRQVEAFERIRVERANLWSALDFCLADAAEATSGAEICRNLWIYWASQGPVTEVARVLAALIAALPGPDRPRATVLWLSAMFASQQGQSTAGIQMGTEALAIGRATNDAEVVAWSLQSLGVAAYIDQRWDDTISYATESLNLARTMGSRFTELSAMVLLAVGRTFRGALDEGIAIAREGIALSEELGETWEHEYLLQFLAVALLLHGEPDEAEQCARQCLRLSSDIGDRSGMASAIEALSSIAVARNAYERAATLLGAADTSWRSIPLAILEPLRPGHESAEAAARGALGDARFEAAYGAGASMTPDEIADYVLERTPRVVAAVSEPSADSPLSRREMEVAQLVAEGATNAQVAAQLFISERTVESHLASVFNKLGVDSRVQVARWIVSLDVAALD
jgi:predicted ATPase/DNA-binding CsgD family transcriptional regulator